MVSTHNPAPDDAQIETHTPQICVDYLSHEWKDEDVWNSWKAMTKRKKEIANGLRLENASWRTWAKQRGKLKTVSPETLNWCAVVRVPSNSRLKESDVTWLYGPLHGEAKAVPPPKVASTAERLGIDVTSGKKSILKHRTLTDMLQTPMGVSPPSEGDSNDREVRPIPSAQKASRGSRARHQATMSLGTLPDSTVREAATAKRHISFNDRVDQCIAIDHDLDIPESDEEASEDEDALAHVSSSPGHHATIARIPPTHLKTPHEYSIEELSTAPIVSSFGDSDDETYGDEARYSVADAVPATHDLSLGQDDEYDYEDSDDDYDIHEPSPYGHFISNTAAPWDSHADTHTAQGLEHSASHNETMSAPQVRLPAQPSNIPDTQDASSHEPISIDVSGARDDTDFACDLHSPTPGNSPIEVLAGRASSVNSTDGASRNTGALVAPPTYMPQVPLAENYVEEHEGGLISTAVEILNTARDLVGTLMGSSGARSRAWYRS